MELSGKMFTMDLIKHMCLENNQAAVITVITQKDKKRVTVFETTKLNRKQ